MRSWDFTVIKTCVPAIPFVTMAKVDRFDRGADNLDSGRNPSNNNWSNEEHSELLPAQHKTPGPTFASAPENTVTTKLPKLLLFRLERPPLGVFHFRLERPPAIKYVFLMITMRKQFILFYGLLFLKQFLHRAQLRAKHCNLNFVVHSLRVTCIESADPRWFEFK
jgi:hypothetical protein